VPHELGERPGLGEDLVDHRDRGVPVGREQRAQPRSHRPDRCQLGLVAVVPAGVDVLAVELVQRRDRGQGVGLFRGVHQHRGGGQRHLRVMGERHVDRLPHPS
jgi:hypothetical protein